MRRRTVVAAALSVVLIVAAGCAGERSQWSWQQAQARVLATGDLEWAPQPFTFQKGDSVRYIDYENGDDENSGMSKKEPWKHHPWDPQATGKAASTRGIHTYVFKRGVTYRGIIVADESGRPGEPIRLTSDPSWGEGEAAIYGSEALVGGWTQADAEAAPGIPEPEKVWYRDIGTDYVPRALWMVAEGQIIRIPIARDPNWQESNPDDVKSEWYTWQKTTKEKIQVGDGEQTKVWAIDAQHLTSQEPDAYVGGTVWSEYSGVSGVMGQPYANPIEAYDPERHAIRFGGPWGDASSRAPIQHCRYFIENLPELLDSPGEYYYAAEGEHAGRLYVRLPQDRDPNTVCIEAARHTTLIDIRGHHNIHISGLTFRFQNVAHWFDRWWQETDVDPSCVKVIGNSTDIRVSIMQAVWMQTAEAGDVMDDLAVTDNEIVHCDYGPIWILRGPGEMYRVDVLRNRLYHVGFRPMRSEHGHAIQVHFAALAEVAGNVLDRCYGAGLFVFGGKGSGQAGVRPLSRILMHHNKVTDPLLNTNDWGGIESWQGGPAYIYDNVSGNPGGYWHWKHTFAGTDPEERTHTSARFGFAYYLDGAFKQYVFNNIAWGKNNDLASRRLPAAGGRGGAQRLPGQRVAGYQRALLPSRHTQGGGARDERGRRCRRR